MNGLKKSRSGIALGTPAQIRRNAVNFSHPPLLISSDQVEKIKNYADSLTGSQSVGLKNAVQSYELAARAVESGAFDQADIAVWWRERIRAEVKGQWGFAEMLGETKPSQIVYGQVGKFPPYSKTMVFETKKIEAYIDEATKHTEHWHPATGGQPERVRKLVPGWYKEAESKGWSPKAKLARGYVEVLVKLEFAGGETAAGSRQQAHV